MARAIPFVATGEPIMCTMGSAFNTMKAGSQQVKRLAGQLQATDADKIPPKFLENPACFGACSATNGQPCAAQMAIAGEWTKTDTHFRIKGQHPLTVASQLPCSKGGIIKFQYMELTIVIEHAMVAAHSYFVPGKSPGKEPDLPPGMEPVSFNDYPDDLKKPDLWQHDESGFHANLYKKGDEYIVVFRGTEDGKDWTANGMQGLGLNEDQYRKANDLAIALENSTIANQTSITGHSLGGGLASLVGAKTQLPTYTFNAAGLHEDTLARYGLETSDAAGVQAYFGDDDVLSLAQDNRKKLLSLLPASLRYGPKGAVKGSAMGAAGGKAAGELVGGAAELPYKALGSLMEAGGKANQMAADLMEGSLGKILDANPITGMPGVRQIIAAGQRSIGRLFEQGGQALQEEVEPLSDWTGQKGRTAGRYYGGGVGGAAGAGYGNAIDSNPVSKAMDVTTTDDLPQAKGTRREILTEAPDPARELTTFLKKPSRDPEKLNQLMEDTKKGHEMEPLIKGLRALQDRGAKHYITSRVP